MLTNVARRVGLCNGASCGGCVQSVEYERFCVCVCSIISYMVSLIDGDEYKYGI